METASSTFISKSLESLYIPNRKSFNGTVSSLYRIVGRSFKIQQFNLSPIYPSVAIFLLKSVPISHPEKPHPSPIQKKIFPYIDTSGGETGLVQQPDKIVARFALTIYPYSLNHSIKFFYHSRTIP